MPKKKFNLHFRIPEYQSPKYEWRRKIYLSAAEQAEAKGVSYLPEDKLEVDIRFYLSGRSLAFHDVDNRAKDVLDALQARFGGPKSIRPESPVISNDNQVYRLLVEKGLPPKQSLGFGHVTVKRYR